VKPYFDGFCKFPFLVIVSHAVGKDPLGCCRFSSRRAVGGWPWGSAGVFGVVLHKYLLLREACWRCS
jgi:hypothetical protein